MGKQSHVFTSTVPKRAQPNKVCKEVTQVPRGPAELGKTKMLTSCTPQKQTETDISYCKELMSLERKFLLIYDHNPCGEDKRLGINWQNTDDATHSLCWRLHIKPCDNSVSKQISCHKAIFSIRLQPKLCSEHTR